MPVSVTNIQANTSTSGATVAATVPAAGVPAGQLIVVITTEKSTSGTDGTLADTAGNTWTKATSGSLAATAADGRGIVWYAWNCKALSNGNTITYTKNLSGANAAISAFWVSGILNGADPLDSAATNTATGTTGTITVTSGTPGTARDFFVGALCDSGSTTAGGNATFTQASGGWATPPNEASTGGSGSARVNGGWLSVTDAATHTYNPSYSSTAQQWFLAIVAFKAVPDTEVISQSGVGHMGELPPLSRDDPRVTRDKRTWTQNLLQSTLSLPLFKPPVAMWDIPPPPRPIDPTWVQNLLESTFSLPLFKPPVADWDIVRQPPWYRDWSQNLLETTLGVQFPPGEIIYDTPDAARGLRERRSWTANYLLELIGQDALPTGEIVYDLTPRPSEPSPRRSWTWSYFLTLIGKDALPTGEIVYDLAPRAPEPSPRRSWSWSYNLNLIGQDALPVGEISYETPRPTEPSPRRSWTWSYLATLIGQDQLPTGKIVADRPPPLTWQIGWLQNLLQGTLGVVGLPPGEQIFDLARAYPRLDQTWIAFYNYNLIGQDQLPTGEIVYDLTPRPAEPSPRRSWTWNYLLTLIGRDVLPIGEISYDLTPRPSEPSPRRTWTWSYNLNLVGQDAFPTGEISYELVPDAARNVRERRSWMASYGLPLIGQDALPPGRIYSDRPAVLFFYREWTQNLAVLYATVPLPFSQFDWPLPRANPRLDQTWTASYNLNLIGRDQLPVGEIISDLAPDPARNVRERRSWTYGYLLELIGQDQLPTGVIVYDLTPRAPEPSPRRTWTWSYLLTLIGFDFLPPGQIVDELPPRAGEPSPRRMWAWSYNLNLIGQDAFPPGAVHTVRPPPLQWYREWVQNLVLNFFTPQLPFSQFDWPVPRPYPRLEQSWLYKYLPTLVAQDQLPPGQIIDDLAPTANTPKPLLQTWQMGMTVITFVSFNTPPPGNIAFYETPPDAARNLRERRSWTWNYFLTLIGQDQLPVGKIVSDTADPFRGTRERRSLTASYSLTLIGRDALPPGRILYELAPRGPAPLVPTWQFPDRTLPQPIVKVTFEWLIRYRRRGRR